MTTILTTSPVDNAHIAERFWRSVNKTDHCFFWTGQQSNRGYGVLSVKNRPRFAHRLAWELAHGPIPDGMFVCHHCDTPLCVRADHLFLGTVSDNVRDAQRKGRLATGERHGSSTHPERIARGEKHGRARLTEESVRKILALAWTEGITHWELAEEFGVTRGHLTDIVQGRCWSHIRDDALLARMSASGRPGGRGRGERNGTATHPERVARGERHGGAKLTAAQVIEIRSRPKPRGPEVKRLAEAYGVSKSTIYEIVRRKTWPHLAGC